MACGHARRFGRDDSVALKGSTNDNRTGERAGLRRRPAQRDVLVYVNGEFVPRDAAAVSVFDAGFVLGDGIWEGLRLVRGKLLHLDEHLDRLFEGAGAIASIFGVLAATVKAALHETARAQRHDRWRARAADGDARAQEDAESGSALRGRRPHDRHRCRIQDAESRATKARGLALWTSTFRCSPPDVFDLRLNSHSRLNLIQALLQAIDAGADEALMLDPARFVASCNSTNFFIVRGGELWTSTGRYNFKGITRRTCSPSRRAGMRRARTRLHAGRNLLGAGSVRHRHARRRHAGDHASTAAPSATARPARITKEASDLYLKSVGAL